MNALLCDWGKRGQPHFKHSDYGQKARGKPSEGKSAKENVLPVYSLKRPSEKHCNDGMHTTMIFFEITCEPIVL